MFSLGILSIQCKTRRSTGRDTRRSTGRCDQPASSGVRWSFW